MSVHGIKIEGSDNKAPKSKELTGDQKKAMALALERAKARTAKKYGR